MPAWFSRAPASHAILALRLATGALCLGCGSKGADLVQAPVLGPPEIRAVSPERAVPGQPVVLVGTNFGRDLERVSVTFDGVPSDVVSVTNIVLVAIVPPDLGLGPSVITVTLQDVASPATAGLSVISPGPPFESLSAGSGFTCAIRRGGGAYCWGAGHRGQLGTGALVSSSPTPVAVVDGGSFGSVSTGLFHACALDRAGFALCWGQNPHGQLGDGSVISTPRPTRVAGGLSFANLSAGSFHTCGVTLQGAAYCWGKNESGQLGNGTTTNSTLPVKVASAAAFAAVTAGGSHTCAVTTAGQAYCWGANTNGELGAGSARNSPLPVPVAGPPFTALSAGRPPPVYIDAAGGHTCGVAFDRRAYCWGWNGHGQLGTGSSASSRAPLPVHGDLAFESISAGAFHTCGITTAGEAYCWGINDAGQLGSGLTDEGTLGSVAPRRVLGSIRFSAISAGPASKTVLRAVRSHTCGLGPGGTAFCWGQNSNGQLGSGTVESHATPVPVTLGD